MNNKSKCLVLSFRNAGIFGGPFLFDDKHRMVDSRGTTAREKGDWEVVPPSTLLKEHVANMLLVLSGGRPVPTFRRPGVCQKIDTSITDLALDALVRVTSGLDPKPHYKTGMEKAITEVMMTRKSVGDSWAKRDIPINLGGVPKVLTTVLPSWPRVRAHLGPEYFPMFSTMVDSVLGSEGKHLDMVEVFSRLYDHRGSKDVQDFVLSPGVPKAYQEIILNGKVEGQYFHASGYGNLKHWHLSTVVRGVEQVTRIDGEIMVPCAEEDLQRFRNGTGCATLLDGGLVYIKEVVQDYMPAMLDGAKPVHTRSAGT